MSNDVLLRSIRNINDDLGVAIIRLNEAVISQISFFNSHINDTIPDWIPDAFEQLNCIVQNEDLNSEKIERITTLSEVLRVFVVKYYFAGCKDRELPNNVVVFRSSGI
jgi:hypothetical protein